MITAELRRAPDVWLVRVVGEIDIDSIEPLRAPLAQAAITRTEVVLDCSAITFADSSFLNAVLLARRTHPVHLAGVRGALRSLLDVTGAAEAFHLHADVPSALLHCGEGRRTG